MINLIQQKLRDSLKLGDSGKTVPTIAFTSESGKAFFIDSLRKKHGSAIRVRPLELPPTVDSILRDPENIKSVNVDEPKSGKNRIITIDYNSSVSTSRNKQLDSSKESRITMKSHSFVRDHRDTLVFTNGKDPEERSNAIFQFLINIDSVYIQDSVTLKEVTAAYAARLEEDKINVQFDVVRKDSADPKSPNAVTIGFVKPVTFDYELDKTFIYIVNKLWQPILFSLLLILLTVAAFVLLYRNMIRQKRLAELKNDLISNISHELKTPIATVGVALEALKSFNAIDDPERTREYLDISQNELQRLNMLVDKVLKLSIFEKKEIELKKERFDYKQLTAEIMNSMKLQFEKYHAKTSLHTEGDNFFLDADKLHITSVVYNLLDNALKYSKENPAINVSLKSGEEYIELSVQDNGIGIPSEYRSRIFDKFFRVPTGDRHNIKGYGLGLSYVAEVVKRHKGQISVDSEAGKGSTFTVRLLRAETPVISLGDTIESKKQTL
jgi:two-component system phosphate regulon sensor histidine kinase PhoR